jgi:hypothetical protein
MLSRMLFSVNHRDAVALGRTHQQTARSGQAAVGSRAIHPTAANRPDDATMTVQ